MYKRTRRDFLKFSIAVGSGFAVGGLYLSGCRQADVKTADRPGKRPNIVFIMADDLGWGDLGCYGQQVTKTPRLDQMAAEGVRFTDCYAGAHMCAPSRATLLTGKHQGHASIREIKARSGPKPKLRPDEITVAHILKKAGYATAAFGKRHAMPVGMSKHFGFDSFAHNHGQFGRNAHYTGTILTENGEVELPANIAIQKRKEEAKAKGEKISAAETEQFWINGTYHDDIMTDRACNFIKEKKDAGDPFFLYLPFFAPHTGYIHPDILKYKDKDWNGYTKAYVSMVERMDSHVGKVMDAIDEAGMDENTIVFFTSDNGAVCRAGFKRLIEHVKPNGNLRKGKTLHYEGGIRVPMIVRWPSRIAQGIVNSTPWYFADIFSTLADIANASEHIPEDVDGISVVPTLLGRQQPELKDRPMYWAGYSWFGFHQVVRKGDYKLIRWTVQGPRRNPMGDVDPVLPNDQYPMLELYNLRTDMSEQNNLVETQPEKTQALLKLLNSPEAHTEEARYPLTKEERLMMASQK